MANQFSYSPLDVALSPFYGLLDTASQLPFVDQTGLGDWVNSTPLFQGAQNFRDAEPGWAGLVDFGASFVPYAGWAGALNRAAAAGRTGGLLGGTNALRFGAANLFKSSPALAFSAGESAAFLPPALAQTGFDYLGGRYDNPVDAAGGLALGVVGGTALGAFGHAVSPFVQRFAPGVIGGTWRAFFEPGPELSRLYGFSDNQKRAVSGLARDPKAQEAVSPVYEPQMRAAALWDLANEIESGSYTGPIQIEPTDIPEYVNLLRGQRDEEIRTILGQELDPTDLGFRYPRDTAKLNPTVPRTIRGMLSTGETKNFGRITRGLTGSPGQINTLDRINSALGLPQEWIHEAQFPHMTQATISSAEGLRAEIGLVPHNMSREFRRIERTGPDNSRQLWSILQEKDGGWLLTTELSESQLYPPTDKLASGHPLQMSWRRMHENAGDPKESARVFLTFKTTNPGRLFENDGWRLDVDDPGGLPAAEALGPRAWAIDSRIPVGQSELLDKALDFRDVYLSKETLRTLYEARLAGKKGKEAFTRALLEGPTMGKQIKGLFEQFTSPADTQLMRNPEARGILGMYRALFTATEGRAIEALHGTASIPEDKSPLMAIFTDPAMNDTEALAVAVRRAVQTDPDVVEVIRKYNNGTVPLKSLEGTEAGRVIEQLHKTNDKQIEDISTGIKVLRNAGATSARVIPHRQGHFGLSRRWDGSIRLPIYKGNAVEPDTVIAGANLASAQKKAADWLRLRAADMASQGKPVEERRIGKPVVVGQDKDLPKWARVTVLEPHLLDPRSDLMGYEHQYDPYKHVDDFIAELEDNMFRRARYGASVMAEALTAGRMNALRHSDPAAWNIVRERIQQLQSQPGVVTQELNRMVDSVAPHWFGTNGATKAVEAANELNFHLLHGVGNIATPLLNVTSVLQTQLPEAILTATADPLTLAQMGLKLPAIGADGLPTRGFNWWTDPIGIFNSGWKQLMDPDDEAREVFNAVINRKELGASLANEYLGQGRTFASRMSEKIRGPEDFAFWAKRLSSFLMEKSEQLSRMYAVGMSLGAQRTLESMHGYRIPVQDKIDNAVRMVMATNYGYLAADRPQMFTSPLGALFGNQKTWMTNYLFQLARYSGLAVEKGNWTPLLISVGATTALGGVFAVPLLGAGIDFLTETFADQDAREFMAEHLGQGGNGVSFGLPGLFGLSLQNNVAAPGSNLAHDAEFFTSIVAWERAKTLGRAVGRAWDDQVMLGMNPFRDELWRKQAAQALAPRSLYRASEALMDSTLRSASTGYPMVREFGLGARILHGLGFRDVDIAVQYAAYESLLKDKERMNHQISVFGDAYAQAVLANDRGKMNDLLQQAAVMGVNLSSVMNSAQTRLRNAGRDMFGRNFTAEQLERYEQQLELGGRNGPVN